MGARSEGVADQGRDQLFSIGEAEALSSGDVLEEAYEVPFGRYGVAVQLQDVRTRVRVGRLTGEDHGIALPLMEGKLPTVEREVVRERSGNGLD